MYANKIFKSSPIESILILPDYPVFTVVDVNDLCLMKSNSVLTDWINKSVIEVNLTKSNQPQLQNKNQIQASLEVVVSEKIEHTIEAQTYFIFNKETGAKEQRLAEIKNSPLFNENGEIELILQTIVDITDKNYFAKLEQLERQVLENEILCKNDIKNVFNMFLKGIEQIHQGMICSILELKGQQLYDLASPNLPELYIEAISGLKIGLNEGSCGTAAFIKESVIVSDIENDIKWEKYKEIAASCGLKACWSFPIINQKGEVIATFANYYKDVKKPGELEENTIKRAAYLMRLILERHIKNEEIIENEKLITDLLNDMQAGVILQDKDEQIIMCNPKALEILEITNELLIGKTSFDINWELVKENGELFNKEELPSSVSLKTKQAVNNFVIGLKHTQNRQIKWILVDAKPQFYQDETIKQVVVTFIDITERKKAEEEIKKSKNTYRGILNSVNEYIFILDSDGLFIDVNQAAIDVYGYERSFFLGKSPAFLAAPNKNNFNIILQAITNAINGQSQQFEFYGITKSGKEITKEVNLSPGLYFGNPAVIVVGRDITERKNSEIILTKTNSLLEATLESIYNGILVVAHDGSIIKYNLKFAELWQIPAEIFENATDKILIDYIIHQLKYPEEFIFKVNELYANKHMESKDQVLFKDGRIYERISKPMFINGEPMGRVWSFGDITFRKQVENELRQSEKKYRKLIDSANEGIIVVQGNSLKFVNPIIVKITGYSEEELLSRSFFDFVYPDDRLIVKRNYLKRLVEDTVLPRFQFRVLNKNNNIKWVEMGGIVIDWKGTLAALNFISDITESFKNIKAIEDQNKRLSDIAWTQSHIVRAPLARLMGLINLIKDEESVDKETNQILKYILESAYEFDLIVKSIVMNTHEKENKSFGDSQSGAR